MPKKTTNRKTSIKKRIEKRYTKGWHKPDNKHGITFIGKGGHKLKSKKKKRK